MAATKAKTKRKPRKRASVTINLRMQPAQRDLIDQAAELLGKNRTEYMLDVTTRAAQDAILDQRIFYLNDEQWEEIQRAIQAPAQVNPKLKQLLSRKSPWEK